VNILLYLHGAHLVNKKNESVKTTCEYIIIFTRCTPCKYNKRVSPTQLLNILFYSQNVQLVNIIKD